MVTEKISSFNVFYHPNWERFLDSVEVLRFRWYTEVNPGIFCFLVLNFYWPFNEEIWTSIQFYMVSDLVRNIEFLGLFYSRIVGWYLEGNSGDILFALYCVIYLWRKVRSVFSSIRSLRKARVFIHFYQSNSEQLLDSVEVLWFGWYWEGNFDVKFSLCIVVLYCLNG